MKPQMCECHGLFLGDAFADETGKIPRRKVTCPVCKRRLLARIDDTSHENETYYLLPPHKVTGWWKKGKPRRTCQ